MHPQTTTHMASMPNIFSNLTAAQVQAVKKNADGSPLKIEKQSVGSIGSTSS